MYEVQSCCCFNLRTGGKAICALSCSGIVLLLFIICALPDEVGTGDRFHAMTIVLLETSGTIVTAGMAYFGISKNKPHWLLPLLTHLFVGMIKCCLLLALHLGFKEIFIWILAETLVGYLTLVMYSLYMEIKRETSHCNDVVLQNS